MGVEEIRADLSYLATDRKIAPSTQNIALSALLFLYRQVLRVALPNIENIERARQTRHLPVVLTREEVKTLLSNIEGVENLVASLLFCDAPIRSRLRYSHCTRVTRTQRYANNDDLYSCIKSRWTGCEKST